MHDYDDLRQVVIILSNQQFTLYVCVEESNMVNMQHEEQIQNREFIR